MTKQITQAFPTLIGRFTIPDTTATNAELVTLLRQYEQSAPGQQYANAGGWHSTSDLLEWPSTAVTTLRGWIVESLNGMVGATAELPEVQGRANTFRGNFRLSAWGNIIRRGHYHRHHNHPGSAWSGVYYVATGPTDPASLSGVLELYDPRPFTEMTDAPGTPYGQRVLVRPQEGLMVIFPGFLYHFVHPLQQEGERISIAFNAAWQPSKA
ncbi:hypothetical protein BH11PLA2_BH11PLA2_02690 [soil metagenome]